MTPLNLIFSSVQKVRKKLQLYNTTKNKSVGSKIYYVMNLM